MLDVQVGHKYRHFKGSLYVVIAIATHEKTGERLVIYRRVDTSPWWRKCLDFLLCGMWIAPHVDWARDIVNFCEIVPEDVSGKIGGVPRFVREDAK